VEAKGIMPVVHNKKKKNAILTEEGGNPGEERGGRVNEHHRRGRLNVRLRKNKLLAPVKRSKLEELRG